MPTQLQPRAAEAAAREEALRALLDRLAARRAKLARTLEKVRAEAARMPLAEEHRALGELIARNAHAIPRGAKSVTLTAYGADGPSPRDVPLDPRRSPKDEAAWHFKQYKRYARGCEIAAKRAAQLEGELESLDARIARARAGAEEPAEPAPVASPRRPSAPPRALPYREYLSHGRRIWVGKDARANDALTFQLAKPHDVWIHARGVPGSHVVVPMQRKSELPQEVLLDAAHLALHHSAAKGEPRGEVAYTRVKHVRRVRGSPGQVTYTQEKTFVVRVELDRIERLRRAIAESDSTP